MNIHTETERLIIKPLAENDFEFILALLNSQGWLRNIGDRNVKNAEDAKRYIQKITENPEYHCSTFSLKGTGQTIGMITFIYRDTQDFPDIGYAMLPEFEKNGFAYEAVRKYLDKIIAAEVTKKVIAITLPENKKSVNLLEKLELKFSHNFIEDGKEFSLFSTTG